MDLFAIRQGRMTRRRRRLAQSPRLGRSVGRRASDRFRPPLVQRFAEGNGVESKARDGPSKDSPRGERPPPTSKTVPSSQIAECAESAKVPVIYERPLTTAWLLEDEARTLEDYRRARERKRTGASSTESPQ
jgi:hypothetical protein